jgi:hypothetical protein
LTRRCQVTVILAGDDDVLYSLNTECVRHQGSIVIVRLYVYMTDYRKQERYNLFSAHELTIIFRKTYQDVSQKDIKKISKVFGHVFFKSCLPTIFDFGTYFS